jgi:GT2 family glycosyltransferase
MIARVLVSIVSYNSGRYLRSCFEGLQSQTFRDFTVSLWDNASTDDSPEIIAAHGDVLDTFRFSTTNLGFCAAHNRVIRETGSDYVLVLNPDVVLEPAFLGSLVGALDRDDRAGAATGKLWRWPDENVHPVTAGGSPGTSPTLDSTGIYVTPNQRHFDRGAGEPDCGQYEHDEYVFGASGAAAFYRRSMLDEIAVDGEYFDEAFFAYREDADLAWRAQWMGWKCRYVPTARAFHVRRVLPERRSMLPADINMHSFKNRFLLRMNNMDAGTYARFFFPILARDVLALGYVLTRERSSLRALPLLARAAPKAWRLRRALRKHRRVSPRDMRQWFSYMPVAHPASNSGASTVHLEDSRTPRV